MLKIFIILFIINIFSYKNKTYNQQNIPIIPAIFEYDDEGYPSFLAIKNLLLQTYYPFAKIDVQNCCGGCSTAKMYKAYIDNQTNSFELFLKINK